MSLAELAAVFLRVSTPLLHLASVVVAICRCRPAAVAAPVRARLPSASCGRSAASKHIEETLRSTFRLDYPATKSSSASPGARSVVPLVGADRRQSQAGAPADRRRPISANPKLNNVVKGWRAAIMTGSSIADSNVLLPPDYVQRLMAPATRTGLVCSLPIGCRPDGVLGRARMRVAQHLSGALAVFADTIGFGFAQGKTMLWRREVLQASRRHRRPRRSNSPKTRPRPRSCERRACGCAWSTAVPAAARIALRRRGVEAAAALGAAAPRELPGLFLPAILTGGRYRLACGAVAASTECPWRRLSRPSRPAGMRRSVLSREAGWQLSTGCRRWPSWRAT